MSPKLMNAKTISRRDFLMASGLTLGAATAACCGLGYAATRPTEVRVVETPSYSYGKDTTVNSRFLIAYATRTGSTVGVVSAIAETLAAKGHFVDVRPLKENPSLDGYTAAILGSAVNGAQWLPEAVQFARDNQAALNQIPLALFCVHIMNLGDDPTSRNKRLAYLDSVRPLLKPVDEAYFAGIGMNPEEGSRWERWLYRAFKVGPEGDCRDWKKIRGWADSLSL